MSRGSAWATGERCGAGNLLAGNIWAPSWNKVGLIDTRLARWRRQWEIGASAPQHIGRKWICSLRKAQKGQQKTIAAELSGAHAQWTALSPGPKSSASKTAFPSRSDPNFSADRSSCVSSGGDGSYGPMLPEIRPPSGSPDGITDTFPWDGHRAASSVTARLHMVCGDTSVESHGNPRPTDCAPFVMAERSRRIADGSVLSGPALS